MVDHNEDNDPFEEDIVFDQAGLLGGKMPKSRQQSTAGFLPTFMLFIRTVFLCIAFIGLGLCSSVSKGPLIKLEIGMGVEESIALHTFTAHSVGMLIGGLLGSFLFEIYNRQFLMFISFIWVAVSVTILPATIPIALWWTFATVAALGAGLGFLFTGGNVLCLDLWGKQGGASLQALHFSFAVGAFIAPVVIHPFFTGPYPSELLVNNSYKDNSASISPSIASSFYRVPRMVEPITESNLSNISSNNGKIVVLSTDIPFIAEKGTTNGTIISSTIVPKNIIIEHTTAPTTIKLLDKLSLNKHLNNDTNINTPSLSQDTPRKQNDSLSKPPKPKFTDANNLDPENGPSWKKKTPIAEIKTESQNVSSTTTVPTTQSTTTNNVTSKITNTNTNSLTFEKTTVTKAAAPTISSSTSSPITIEITTQKNPNPSVSTENESNTFNIEKISINPQTGISTEKTISFDAPIPTKVPPLEDSILSISIDSTTTKPTEEEKTSTTLKPKAEENASSTFKPKEEEKASTTLKPNEEENTSSTLKPNKPKDEEKSSITIKPKEEEKPSTMIVSKEEKPSTTITPKEEKTFISSNFDSFPNRESLNNVATNAMSTSTNYKTLKSETYSYFQSQDQEDKTNFSNDPNTDNLATKVMEHPEPELLDLKESPTTSVSKMSPNSTIHVVKPGTYSNETEETGYFLETMADKFRNYGVTKIHLAYITIGIFVFLNSLISVVILCHNPREPRSKQDDGHFGIGQRGRVVIFTLLFSIYMFTTEALQGAVHHLLASISSPKNTIIMVNKDVNGVGLFWGIVSVSRFLCIIISGCIKLKPGKFLVVSTFFTLVGTILLCIGTFDKSDFLWGGIIVVAIGLAPILPTSFLWMAQYMKVTHRMCALMIILSSFGNSLTHSILTHIVGTSHLYSYILTAISFISLVLLLMSMIILYTADTNKSLGVPVGYQLANQQEEEDNIELTPSASTMFSHPDQRLLENGEAGQALLID